MAKQSSSTDVLIIGSGPVGATFARLLGCCGSRVTMIDAGPHLSASPGRHLANAYAYQQHPNLFLAIILAQLEVFSVPSNPRRELPDGAFIPPPGRVNFENPAQQPDRNMPFASASYAVGGMGTHWTCCTPDPAEMERTPLVPPEEWPVLLGIARKLLNVHTDAFSPSFTNEVVKEALHKRGFPVTDLPMAAEKRRDQDPDHAHMVTWTGTDTVLGSLLNGTDEERQRLTILAEHRVERLLMNGHKVEGAEILDLTNHTRKTIYAETVVVSAGPLLTPLVLWRSGLDSYALGRYLNANTTVCSSIVLTTALIERLRANCKANDPIVPIAWDDPPVMLGTSPTEEKPWRTQIQRKGRYLSHDLLEHVQLPEPFTDARLELDLIWFGMVKPRPENRITFTNDLRDRFGQPQMTIHYAVGDEERELEKVLREDMTQAADAIGRFIPGFDGSRPETPGSTLHYHGTCRMGDDPATSVVDSHCKVWGIDNLYLGSVGVIPTSMATNPTLTACALASRAAARIAGRSPQDLAVEIGVTERV